MGNRHHTGRHAECRFQHIPSKAAVGEFVWAHQLSDRSAISIGTQTCQQCSPLSFLPHTQVTLTGVAAGYYRVRVAVVRDTDEFPRTFPATDGVAVGTPGAFLCAV